MKVFRLDKEKKSLLVVAGAFLPDSDCARFPLFCAGFLQFFK